MHTEDAMAKTLDRELKKYQENLPQLLPHEGKFVLICGDAVVGLYDSYEDALAIGYEKCGVEPFLVKKISSTEQISYFTRDLGTACLT